MGQCFHWDSVTQEISTIVYYYRGDFICSSKAAVTLRESTDLLCLNSSIGSVGLNSRTHHHFETQVSTKMGLR